MSNQNQICLPDIIRKTKKGFEKRLVKGIKIFLKKKKKKQSMNKKKTKSF